MAHNPELDYEFREGKETYDKKPMQVFPSENPLPAGNVHRSVEPELIGNLNRMNSRENSTLHLIRTAAIGIATVAVVLGVMFFLSATHLLPLL